MYQYSRIEVPVAYSMIHLANRSPKYRYRYFQEYMCYWAAFNTLYSTIAEQAGKRPTLSMDNGEPRVRQLWNYKFPVVRIISEIDQIDEALNLMSFELKHRLIVDDNTRFFVYRVPKGIDTEYDQLGQRINGVLNLNRTVNNQYPVWSPVDICMYENYMDDKQNDNHQAVLADQIVKLLYIVRNNLFHGGKRADDAIDREVVNHALPLLKMIVKSFLHAESKWNWQSIFRFGWSS